jgi:hypothetical protein
MDIGIMQSDYNNDPDETIAIVKNQVAGWVVPLLTGEMGATRKSPGDEVCCLHATGDQGHDRSLRRRPHTSSRLWQ